MQRHHRGKNLSVVFIFLLAGSILILSGCPNTQQGTVIRGDTGGPKQHVWQSLIEMHSEEKGYGMYTYVLFGRKLKRGANISATTLERYERLLQAIHLSTLSKPESGDIEKEETNIFLIPTVAETEEPSRHNYNSIVSLRYLSLSGSLTRKSDSGLADKLIAGEGPFLISTPQPLGEMQKTEVELLYADLSSTNPAAMDEIVGAYKQRIGKDVQTIERFKSLRLAVLDLILDVDDNIKIVQTAFAGE